METKNETVDKTVEALKGIQEKIATLKARALELEAKQRAKAEAEAKAFREKLEVLPATVGLVDVPALINALKSINKASGTGKGGRKLPDGAKDGIIAALKEGAMTGREIATKFGVSLPTVQNYKKQLGLVHSRS